MKFLTKVIFVAIMIVTVFSCSKKRRFIKSPIDELITAYNAERDFSIILYDMDYDEKNDAYKHQYQILLERSTPDTLIEKKTSWYTVSDELFNAHVNDMGMELVSKKDGVLKKAVSPAGYSNYIGNKKYGHWVERDGNRFWEFYGRYAMMRSIFNLTMMPVRYSYWDDYYSGYYGYGRTYYGPQNQSGQTVYGTNGSYSKNPTNEGGGAWNSKSNSFKDKVRSRVKQSAAKSKASRISRSSSRYSSNSSRSRSGGFGK